MRQVTEDNIKNLVKIMMAEHGVDNFSDIAKDIGKKETTFRAALNQKHIKLTDFIKVANLLEYEVVIKRKDE
ncbi:hypothetical protein D1872_180480 [compost metagenome]